MGQKRTVKERLMRIVQNVSGCDLLDKLLLLDPKTRIDADTALNHDFFWTDPMPSELGKMLSNYHQSMFEFFIQPRQSSHMRRHYRQMNTSQMQGNKPQDNSYHDRVY